MNNTASIPEISFSANGYNLLVNVPLSRRGRSVAMSFLPVITGWSAERIEVSEDCLKLHMHNSPLSDFRGDAAYMAMLRQTVALVAEQGCAGRYTETYRR